MGEYYRKNSLKSSARLGLANPDPFYWIKMRGGLSKGRVLDLCCGQEPTYI